MALALRRRNATINYHPAADWKMKIDFKEFHKNEILPDAKALLPKWFPAGKFVGRKFVIGNIKGDAGDSLSVDVDKGIWKDFATNDYGKDLISLYAANKGISQSEAARELGAKESKEDVYISGNVCHPIPQKKGWDLSGVWEYKNPEGELQFYVCRWDKLNERKQFSPLSCWQTYAGKIKWEWKKPPIDPHPYHAYEAAQNPAAKILIVEGEKSADAAQLLLPADWIAVSWCGGASTAKKTNWGCLKDRFIWIWPDADEPGKKAAQQIKDILPQAQIVDVSGFPDKWDLADAGTDFDVIEHLKSIPKTNGHHAPDTINDTPAQTKQQYGQLLFTHTDGNKILATMDNMRDLLNYYKIICRYNVISKRVFHNIPGEIFSTENEEEAALACIYSKMKEWQMAVDGYKLYLTKIADENQYNPVLQWIESKPWDGRPRIGDLCATIESLEEEAKNLLIRRWLITAVAMIATEGVDSAGCLVLQGKQDLGKTWWVRKLVSESVRADFIRTDAMVDPRDKDSVSQVISYWIVELGEIGATFRKADIDALKAFITRDKDIMRRPYGEGDKRYPRRTALIASVDQTIYLHDTAGNRRFWTIPCTSINSYHTIDMQQLWAEVLHLFRNGESWQLEPDEKEHIKRINEEHMNIEPIHELINQKYFQEDEYGRPTRTEPEKTWKSATEIARELEFKNPTQRETRIITSYLKSLNVPSRKPKNLLSFKI